MDLVLSHTRMRRPLYQEIESVQNRRLHILKQHDQNTYNAIMWLRDNKCVSFGFGLCKECKRLYIYIYMRACVWCTNYVDIYIYIYTTLVFLNSHCISVR